MDDGEERFVEILVGSKSYKKDYYFLFEFISVLFMFLFIEKVIKGGERLFELKKDELMIDFNIKDVVFLRLL